MNSTKEINRQEPVFCRESYEKGFIAGYGEGKDVGFVEGRVHEEKEGNYRANKKTYQDGYSAGYMDAEHSYRRRLYRETKFEEVYNQGFKLGHSIGTKDA